MTDFEFTLSAEDTDRLFTIKKLQGDDDLSGNEFAKKLLERELYRLFPAAPIYSDSGRLMNAEAYQG